MPKALYIAKCVVKLGKYDIKKSLIGFGPGPEICFHAMLVNIKFCSVVKINNSYYNINFLYNNIMAVAQGCKYIMYSMGLNVSLLIDWIHMYIYYIHIITIILF